MATWEEKTVKDTFRKLKDKISFIMSIDLLAVPDKDGDKPMFSFTMKKKRSSDRSKVTPTEVIIGVLNGERTEDGKSLLSVIKSNDDFRSLSEDSKKELKAYLKQKVCEEIDNL